MIDFDDLMAALEDAEALLLEPRAVFDQALVGITDSPSGQRVAVYDSQACIDALAAQEGWERDEAAEFFEYNTLGAYVGAATPLFVDLLARA